MTTICDLCNQNNQRLQTIIKDKTYCIIADNLGPMNGPYRIPDTDFDEDPYNDTPPYKCTLPPTTKKETQA